MKQPQTSSSSRRADENTPFEQAITTDATPQFRGFTPPPAPEPIDPTKHVGHTVNGRTAKYHFACPACQREDSERRQPKSQPGKPGKPPNIPLEDLGRTIFLIPNFPPEHNICLAYVRRTYPQAVNVGSTFNYEIVSRLGDMQIVVVLRRPEPGHELTPTVRARCREDGKWVDDPTPMAELLPDVLESAPIRIGDVVEIAANSLTSAGGVDTDELVDCLADVAQGYRVFRGNPPDQLIEIKVQ